MQDNTMQNWDDNNKETSDQIVGQVWDEAEIKGSIIPDIGWTQHYDVLKELGVKP